jgi:hypothetical protein
MQICGQEVNIESLKGKALELGALMEDPEVLSAIQAKVAEANAELASFKPEIPEIPNLQDALSELNQQLSSAEVAAKIQKIKENFGEAVDDLDEIINKVNPKINEFLGALDEGLQKLGEKLSIEGTPTIDTNTLCKDVPNIEVRVKEIDVQEVKQKIINGEPQVDSEGKPVTETVTVKKEVKTRVNLPEEPKVPKEVPIPPEPKPVQITRTVDPKIKADSHLVRVSHAMVKALREDKLGEFKSDRQLYRQKTQAYVFFYYLEVAKQLGVKGSTNREIQANAIKRRMRAKWGVDVELAETLVPKEDWDYLYRAIGFLYESQPLKGTNVYISDTVSYKEALGNYARLQPIS